MDLSDPVKTFFEHGEAWCPKVSPDDRWVAVCWDTGNGFDLWACDLQTEERRQLTDGQLGNKPENTWHRWTPDSSGLFFLGPADVESTTVYRVSLSGDLVECFTATNPVQLWGVNPQTGYLYYRREPESLHYYEPEGDRHHELLTFPGLLLNYASGCAVSSDGRWLSYPARPPETEPNEPNASVSGIVTYVADADGQDAVRLEQRSDDQVMFPVQWHPDNRRLLVLAREGGDWTEGGRTGLYDRIDGTFDWILDEKVIGLLDAEQMLGPATPSMKKKLIDLGGNETPLDCEGLCYMCNGDEAFINTSGFVMQKREHGFFEVFAHDIDTETTTRLFGSEPGDDGVFDELVIEPEQRPFETSDGEQYDGLLYLPRDGETPYPTVAIVYGSQTWSHTLTARYGKKAQVLSHAGYAVYLPDCPAKIGSWREHELIADAGRWLQTQPEIENDRTAVYGHSHGGDNVYMQAAKWSEVWDAFIADSGGIDFAERWDATVQERIGSPSENPERYRELSPITHVDESMGHPLLIIHGALDGAADHSRRLKDRLAELGWREGVEYEHVEQPGVGHAPKEIGDMVEKWGVLLGFLDERLS